MRTTVVVGASSGIGRATAHQLASRGDQLVLAARSVDALEETRQECVARGASGVLVVPVDVGDREQVTRLFDESVARFDRVDVVVHASAVLAYGRFEDVPPDVFDKILQTNLVGTANVARSTLKVFDAQQGGSLVVVGSVLAKMVAPYLASYSTGKWGVQGLVRTLQVEARAKPGVQISLVSPGGVDTPIYDQAGSYTGHPGHPPPPVVSPERVARAVVSAVDKPGRDISAGPLNSVMVAGFRLVPGVFDLLVGPMMRVLGQGREAVEDNAGNVFDPIPSKESVRGRWPHIWG